MKVTIIKFGVYALICAGVLFMSALVLGEGLSYRTQEIIGYASIIVSLSFVYFGIKSFRDNLNHGKVSFWKAFTIGLLISAFAALGFAVVDYIYTSVINPDFMDQYVENIRSQGHEGEIPTYSSGFMAAFMFFTVVLIGIIISIISALILQRK